MLPQKKYIPDEWVKLSLYFRNRPGLKSSIRHPRITNITAFHNNGLKQRVWKLPNRKVCEAVTDTNWRKKKLHLKRTPTSYNFGFTLCFKVIIASFTTEKSIKEEDHLILRLIISQGRFLNKIRIFFFSKNRHFSFLLCCLITRIVYQKLYWNCILYLYLISKCIYMFIKGNKTRLRN